VKSRVFACILLSPLGDGLYANYGKVTSPHVMYLEKEGPLLFNECLCPANHVTVEPIVVSIY
jgi:hypothetical protein